MATSGRSSREKVAYILDLGAFASTYQKNMLLKDSDAAELRPRALQMADVVWMLQLASKILQRFIVSRPTPGTTRPVRYARLQRHRAATQLSSETLIYHDAVGLYVSPTATPPSNIPVRSSRLFGSARVQER